MVLPGGCFKDPEECDCDCHTNENVMHVAPCCFPCQYCGKRVRLGFHEERCSQNPERKMVEIMKNIVDICDSDAPNDMKLELARKIVAVSLEWARAPREERNQILEERAREIKQWINEIYLSSRKKGEEQS